MFTPITAIVRTFQRLLSLGAGFLLASCTKESSSLTPVGNFDAVRYLGRWYEIARLPNQFEEGLSNVRADYTARGADGITVVNSGYDAAAQEWRSVQGVAHFAGARDVGYLRVSFFRPFYADYRVLLLDTNAYQYAMVAGNDRSYLWILARTPQLAAATQAMLVARAAALGFATNQLVYVVHDRAADY